MAKYTLDEWRKEGKKRFGEDYADWAFVCPACGKVSKGSDFKTAGANPNDMYQTCIGRHNGKGVKGAACKQGDPAPEFGCDWAAFGLFGALGNGDVVVADDGKETDVFRFADEGEK